MCELFGLSSRRKIELREDLTEFFSHGTANPHGWGIAVPNAREIWLKKEPVPSYKSPWLRNALRSSLEAKLMLAHLRLSTKGSIEYLNTHPFLAHDNAARPWALIHNGTIFESDVLSGYVRTQEGGTDSERILCHLMTLLRRRAEQEGRFLCETEIFRTVEDVIAEIVPENKVNLLITDGTHLYIHCNYRKSLHWLRRGETMTVSTYPLAGDGWEEIPLNTLFVVRDGIPVYQGTPHDCEFFDSEEKMRFLYLDYAGI